MSRHLAVACLLALTACWGRGDTGQREDTGGAVDDTGPGFNGPGFAVTGTVWDLEADGPAGAGLCVIAADPTNALIGLPLEELVSGETDTDGSYELLGIEEKPSIGLILIVRDCEGAPTPTVQPTSTGLANEDYADLDDGDYVTGKRIHSTTVGWAAALEADLVAAGETGADLTAGFVFGQILDDAGMPLGSAVVGCTGCDDIYYFDADDTDGLFQTGAAANAATSASARAMWIRPDPAIKTFTVDHPSETFGDQLFGSVAGNAAFLQLSPQ